MQILSALERDAFETPPVFSAAERKRAFDFPTKLIRTARDLRSPSNVVNFLTAAGYFRTTRKFYSVDFHAVDLAYVADRLDISVATVGPYDRQSAARHRMLILRFFGFGEFDLVAESETRSEVAALIRARLKPGLIFQRVLERLVRQRVVIPSYDLLNKLILDQIRQFKAEVVAILNEKLGPEGRRRLDALFDKVPAPTAAARLINRSRLTLLKRFSQSTKPSRIKESVADLMILRGLFTEFQPIVEALHLTTEGIRHYAGSVIRSEIFALARRNDEDRYLHLLAFITHQYSAIQDTLVDVLLRVTRSFLTTAKREEKENCYDTRHDHRDVLRRLGRLIDDGVAGTIERIRVVLASDIPDPHKLDAIASILDALEPRHRELLVELAPFKPENQPAGETGFYQVVTRRSATLQARAAPILSALRFLGTGATTALMKALTEFTPEGPVQRTTSFLSDEEVVRVYEDGRLHIPLYKALLILNTAEAIRNGTLNLRHSYKYRPLAEYLIPEADWLERRAAYLEQADLEGVADVKKPLARWPGVLDQAYRRTNRTILENANPHLSFPARGAFVLHTPKVPETETESLTALFPARKYVSLLEVLATIHRVTGFLDEFEHWQPSSLRAQPPERVFIAGIVGLGCEIGASKMAHISTHVAESELEHIINWHFGLDGIHAANDRLVRLMDELALPNVYRRDPANLHTSSDGQKFEVTADSLNAAFSFKYFGSGKGVSVYSFIDERHLLFHSTVISAAERESAYVIDGLMHNDVVKSTLHSTDSHGFSEVVFAVLNLLGFSFAPRIRDLKRQRRYSFESRKVYADLGFRILPDGYINTKLIEDNWDDILRFVATIKLKVSTASDLFRRLNSYSRQHSLYRALKEFGKLAKTEHILRWIDDVDYRQAVEKQLNRVELSHRLARAVSVGHPGQFGPADKLEQEIAEGCKRLIKNAIICWNYLYLSQMISDETDPVRRAALVDSVRHHSVISWQHINMLGEYDFSDEKLKDSVGFQLPKILALDLPKIGS